MSLFLSGRFFSQSIMPQLDKFTYFSQFFWLCLILFTLFIAICNDGDGVLGISRILKLRNQLLSHRENKQRLKRLFIFVRAFARISKMDGRGEQGPAPRQDPPARAADPAGGGENDRLRRRIIKKIVKILGRYCVAYCGARIACGISCPRRVPEQEVLFRAKVIAEEEFYIMDSESANPQSLTNLLRLLGKIEGDTDAFTPRHLHEFTPFLKEQEREVRDCAPGGPSSPPEESG